MAVLGTSIQHLLLRRSVPPFHLVDIAFLKSGELTIFGKPLSELVLSQVVKNDRPIYCVKLDPLEVFIKTQLFVWPRLTSRGRGKHVKLNGTDRRVGKNIVPLT